MRKARLKYLFSTLIFIMLTLPIFGIGINEGAKIFALRSIPVEVAGTGSMYPSLFWSTEQAGPEDPSQTLIPEYRTTPHLYFRFPGVTLAKHRFFRPSLGNGDLIAFKNNNTRAILQNEGKNPDTGFIKRIIASPGDTLELRDGFVYRNGTLLDEPYLASPRSTYGDNFLSDCHPLTIPPDYYFVMGDNRKVSADSRGELGLVADNDITYYLPYTKQSIYHTLYRDTSADQSLIGTATLAPAEFLTLVNKARNATNVNPLRLSLTLASSATLQAKNILRGFPAPLSALTESVGYHNIVLAEFSTYGAFSATELFQNLLNDPSTAKPILSADYQDLGLGVVNQVVDGCPRQIIVGQLGGYVPASYAPSMRTSWASLLTNLNAVIPTWESAKDYFTSNSSQLNMLLTILYRRRALAIEVLNEIDHNQWFSSDLKARISQDSADANHAAQLVNQLNGD